MRKIGISMAVKIKDSIQDRLTTLQGKAQMMVEKYHTLEQQKRASDDKVKSLEDEILRMRQQIEQLNTKIEYLQVTSTISPSRSELEQTKKVLSGLVREINKCITDLTH